MKDSGFRIRVQRDLRQQFVETCRAVDKPAAQVMREFMRDYVARHLRASGSVRPSDFDVVETTPEPEHCQKG